MHSFFSLYTYCAVLLYVYMKVSCWTSYWMQPIFWLDRFCIISRFGLRRIQQEDMENQWRVCKMLGGSYTILYIIAQMLNLVGGSWCSLVWLGELVSVTAREWKSFSFGCSVRLFAPCSGRFTSFIGLHVWTGISVVKWKWGFPRVKKKLQ